MGPGPAQIWRNSGFVKSKIDDENAAVWSAKWCNLQKKKRSSTKTLTVFLAEIKWSPPQKQKRSSPKFWRFFRWAFHFSMYFGWVPSRAHGPPKFHGPRGHCPPLPPSRWPWSQTGIWGRSKAIRRKFSIWQSPQSLGNFCKFLERKSYFNAIGSHFARVHSHLKELVFLTFESQSKKFNCSIFLLLEIKVQNTFKILHCGVKF